MAQIRARRRVVEMKMSRSSIINIQQEQRRGILSRKRMRRTTVVSVTKMLQQHSLVSLRDGPLAPHSTLQNPNPGITFTAGTLRELVVFR